MNNNQIFVLFLASALTFAQLNQDNSNLQNSFINSLVNTSLITLGIGAYFYLKDSRRRQVAPPFGGNNQPQQQPQPQPQPFPQPQHHPLLLPGVKMPRAA